MGTGLFSASARASKIEIEKFFSTDPLCELRNLAECLLYFGVFRNRGPRLLISRFVSAGHNDQPVSGIWASFKPAQPIADPVFEVRGLQRPGDGRHYIDGSTTIMRDG